MTISKQSDKPEKCRFCTCIIHTWC